MYFDCDEQLVQVFGLVTGSTTTLGRVTTAVLPSLFDGCSGDNSSVQGNIQRPPYKFDGILTDGLIEIRVEFLWFVESRMESQG